jgi:N-sulfoglucosamine sulfohydrolase
MRTCFPFAVALLLSIWAGTIQAAGPNFVIFLADDQGYGDLGCYGHPTLKTAGIDRLAAEGMRFDKAFLTISSCSPTRCSLLTGRYPHNTGAEDLHEPLPANQVSLARLLKAQGYHNMAVGKWHLGDAERDHWHAIEECGGDELGEVARKLLAKRPPGKPFFFWVASKDPHRPYGDESLPRTHRPEQAIVPPYLPDHPLIREDMADYYDEITRFSGQVNRIVELLEGEGVLDETFIAYLSDNGMPFPRAKTTLYDSGIRTPLIVRYPPLAKPGTLQRNLVSTIDLTATVAELAGLDRGTMQGESLVPMLRDFQAPGREAVFAEANWHDFEKFTRAVRTERYLLIRNYYWDEPLWNSVDSINSKTWVGLLQMHRQGRLTAAQRFLFEEPRPYEEFYDLQVDPQSLENVADRPRYTAELNRHRTLLDNWRVATDDRMPAQRRRHGWTRDGRPLPHNQPWYDRFLEAGGKSDFENF